MPDGTPISPGRLAQTQRLAAAKRRLLAEWPWLTHEQLVERGGDPGEALICVADDEGRACYPRFQFDDQLRVRDSVREVVEALAPGGLSGWSLWLWFCTGTGWLSDERPVDLLDSDLERVRMAAENLCQFPF